MKYILSQTIFIGFILALYFAVDMLHKRDMKYKENSLFVKICFCSALWSFGFFGVILQTDPQKAYLWRAIGMVGTFGYLIVAQYIVCHLSGVKKIYCLLTEGFSLLGIVIFFLVIQKDQVTYMLSDIGMTYSFHSTIQNNLYIIYTALVAFNQFWIILYMIYKKKAQRTAVLAKKLLVVECIMVLGMLLDTIFPMLGKTALPGSTIAQFVGLIVIYHSISFVNHSRITIDNMSQFIYYSLAMPVLVYDSAEKLQILNDTAFSFLGVNKDEMEKITIDTLFRVSSEEVFQYDDNSQIIDTICIHNETHCSLTVNKIFDGYGDMTGYIIIVTDLSERVKTMRSLEDAMREAEAANRAKSVFLANMSHEIRTPMNAIIGFSEILLKMNVDKEVRGPVEDIKEASHNLLAIINDILDISRIESGKMELVADNYFMANLLNDVTTIIIPQAQKKKLQFVLKVDEMLPQRLYGDVVRIRSILVNLLNNAVKYTGEGTITFEVFTLLKQDKKIKLMFRVTDTGDGIKEENMNTLFEGFERLDQKEHHNIEGTGLGLAIVKDYVELMGGEISVSSRYGEGTVFTVVIEQIIVDETPVEKDYMFEKQTANKEEPEALVIQNTKVLVVDDNPVNLKVADGILRTYGMAVEIVTSGKEAIELCEKTKYDIVFMDQMMPGMDGYEAMVQIRELNNHYAVGGPGKIIVLTANAIKGTRESVMKQGFDEYLSKPIKIKRLEHLLRKFISEENILTKKSDNTCDNSTEYNEIKYLKDTLQKVDVDLGMSHCGGTVKDYLKILDIIYKYGEKQIRELNQLWEDKDYKTYHIKVHALKSTLLNMGAKELSQEAKKQEEACKEGNYVYIEDNIEKLTKDGLELVNCLKDVLIHFEIISPKSEEYSEAFPQLNEKMILYMFRNIKNYIDNFEFAKVFDILDEAKKYSVPQQYKQTLEQVERYMDDLSVDEVEELLKNILN